MVREAEEIVSATYTYVTAFVDELHRAGLHHMVICPGSRSTPLALACASQKGLQVWMHVDERSAAFFALGMAKKLRQPVGLVCTSGTAAANFLPALVEAKLTHVPLLVLTADRPPELRDTGAPQSIDQNRLYGTHVKWFVEVALPEATPSALRYIRTLADRAVARSQAIPAGPIHLNMPFREPLVPTGSLDLDPPVQDEGRVWQGKQQHVPFITIQETPLAAPPADTIADYAERLRHITQGLIVVGPCDYPTLADPLIKLAEQLGYPILADPLSQLRCGDFTSSQIITSYDAFLRTETFTKLTTPEIVVRFGAMPTSKPYLLYLQRHPSCPQILIDGHGGWEDPTQQASEVIHSDPVVFCQHLLQALATPIPARVETKSAWLTQWQEADHVTKQVLYTGLHDFPDLFEGRVFSELAALLPSEATLFAGNSMPIRDLDTFLWRRKEALALLGNRGANGIDGIVSTALGISAAQHGSSPTVLVIGDLSFYHDLNGLLAARMHQLNLTIVLINNNGGGIFSFLPQATHPEHFEQLFGTPTYLDFQPAVQMYGGTFQRVNDWEGFRAACRRGFEEGGLQVIEVVTERESNVRMHRQLWQITDEALKCCLGV